MYPAILKALFYVFARLPLPVLHAIGTGFGMLFSLIPNRHREVAEINLRACFPELGKRERRRLLRSNLIESAKSFTETGVLWTADRDAIARLVRATSGEEIVRAHMRAGKGMILAAPHLGAWEMVGSYVSMNYPMTSLYRPPRMPEMNDIMRRARERLGAHLMPADASGIRALYKALDRGELVAILPDQVPADKSGAVFAPFFGRPASTMVLLSRLTMKTGAPVVFGYAERLPHGRGYHLHFLPAPEEITTGDMDTSVATVNAMVEKCARALPEQYQWSYKRFRVKPPGQPALY
jgi:KDO2-lipid IV(A) lauroyltransferase